MPKDDGSALLERVSRTSLWGGVTLWSTNIDITLEKLRAPSLRALHSLDIPSCLQLGGEESVDKSQALGVFMGSINPLRSMITYTSHTDPTPIIGSSTIHFCSIPLHCATTWKPYELVG